MPSAVEIPFAALLTYILLRRIFLASESDQACFFADQTLISQPAEQRTPSDVYQWLGLERKIASDIASCNFYVGWKVEIRPHFSTPVASDELWLQTKENVGYIKHDDRGREMFIAVVITILLKAELKLKSG